jgi:hypothetical protein
VPPFRKASRICVSKHLSREERTRVKNELVLSFLEFGLLNDIREMVGIMPPKLWQNVFVNAGLLAAAREMEEYVRKISCTFLKKDD